MPAGSGIPNDPTGLHSVYCQGDTGLFSWSGIHRPARSGRVCANPISDSIQAALIRPYAGFVAGARGIFPKVK